MVFFSSSLLRKPISTNFLNSDIMNERNEGSLKTIKWAREVIGKQTESQWGLSVPTQSSQSLI
jgi:hypothetical protein